MRCCVRCSFGLCGYSAMRVLGLMGAKGGRASQPSTLHAFYLLKVSMTRNKKSLCRCCKCSRQLRRHFQTRW